MQRLILTLLLWPWLLLGQGFTLNDPAFVGQWQEMVVPCDECTGNLIFSWHAEDTDVTKGNPCGCSVGDITAALTTATISNEQAQDGVYCLRAATRSAYAAFSVSSSDIIKGDAGTLIFHFRYTGAWVNTVEVFDCNTDASNRIQIYTAAGPKLRLRVGAVTVDDASNLSADTWYKITCKWQATGTPNRSIQVDSGAAATEDTDFTAQTIPSTIYFGDKFNSGDMTNYLDNIKIYSNWQ